MEALWGWAVGSQTPQSWASCSFSSIIAVSISKGEQKPLTLTETLQVALQGAFAL